MWSESGLLATSLKVVHFSICWLHLVEVSWPCTLRGNSSTFHFDQQIFAFWTLLPKDISGECMDTAGYQPQVERMAGASTQATLMEEGSLPTRSHTRRDKRDGALADVVHTGKLEGTLPGFGVYEFYTHFGARSVAKLPRKNWCFFNAIKDKPP